MNVRFGIFALQEQQLSDDRVRNLSIDLLPQKNDPVFQQATLDVVDALVTTSVINDVGNVSHCLILVWFIVQKLCNEGSVGGLYHVVVIIL